MLYVILGVVRSNHPNMVIYLSQDGDSRDYVVKALHPDGSKTIIAQTYSFSTALREMADVVEQLTGKDSTWSAL